jgi:HK97 family phage portal protein
MGLFTRFWKSATVETKSGPDWPGDSVAGPASLAPLGLLNAWLDMNPHQAWSLYKSSSTVSRCVDLLAVQVAHLETMVRDPVTGHLTAKHAALDLLRDPGNGMSQRGFVRELAVQLLVTGSAHALMLGNVNNPPLALDTVQSRHATSIPGTDGLPETWWISEPQRSYSFQRMGVLRPRYIDNGFTELVTAIEQNGDHKGVGLSRLSSIGDEVALWEKAILANRSVLEKGARPSGILSFKDELTSDQKKGIMEQVREMFIGYDNAGGVMITGGGESAYTPVGQSAKDLDYREFLKMLDALVIDRFGIPQALYSVAAQTHNNYETAWKALFQQAVFPIWETIFDRLGMAFSQRYGERIEFAFDPLKIDLIAAERALHVKTLMSTHAVTPDEGRARLGLDPIDGGGKLYAPSNLVPLAENAELFAEGEADVQPGQANVVPLRAGGR